MWPCILRCFTGAYSNYALKVTAIENKDKFGEEAAQTLQNNFYADDLLKTVANEDNAVQIIKKVTGMCYEGDFNLTKFTSNSKRVQQSIPEKDEQVLRTKVLQKVFQRIKC